MTSEKMLFGAKGLDPAHETIFLYSLGHTEEGSFFFSTPLDAGDS